MVYAILKKLEHEKKLYSCSMTIFHPGAINNRRFLFGREIIDFNMSFIRVRGGETGYEEYIVPLGHVMELESEGKIIFKKKPRIEKVYPR